jgi:hypothetical protein
LHEVRLVGEITRWDRELNLAIVPEWPGVDPEVAGKLRIESYPPTRG